MSQFLERLSYLVTRMILRPERAVTVVEAYKPAGDVIFLSGVGAIWILVVQLAFLGVLGFFRGAAPSDVAASLYPSLQGYVFVLLTVSFYAASVSLFTALLGAGSRFVPLLLSYLLSAVVALSLLVLPCSVIKIVDYGPTMTPISRAIIFVLPWIYIVILMHRSTIRIYRTLTTRALTFMVCGALPLVVVWLLARPFLPPVMLIGLR